jgi:uncharacterized caspase-like protein
VVYFAGHGLTGPRRHELYLSLADTDPDELRVSALPFEWLREIFLDSPATNRVLILDCCYSGCAVTGFMTSSTEVILCQTEIDGTYTIASTAADTLALAPQEPPTPPSPGNWSLCSVTDYLKDQNSSPSTPSTGASCTP